MTHVTGLGDLLWLVQDPQFSILLLFSIDLSESEKRQADNIVPHALSRIPWPLLPLEWNADEHFSDNDTASELKLNVILITVDAAMPAMLCCLLLPLIIGKIGEEQRRDVILILVLRWIENALPLTPIELDGQTTAMRTYAGRRENSFPRIIIGLVLEPCGDFN